jgi:lipopolysaccharide/colanic/teichoic acid biosynthesis glycosyltransferase
MRIWPVLLDSQPSYLRGSGRSTSLLLAPVGTGTLLEYLTTALAPITGNPPLIVSQDHVDPEYERWIRAVEPRAHVVSDREHLIGALAPSELSDAFLIVDPRCFPIDPGEYASLMAHHVAEPRAAHHLVAFDTPVAGTKEQVNVDRSGQIRGVHRHYEEATWPFIAGVAASIMPAASGIVADGLASGSLLRVRQLLVSRGIPSRDVTLEARALDLSEEHGMLAANELLTLEAAAAWLQAHGDGGPVLVGKGQRVHEKARLVGPIVIHADADIHENATIVGPTVIGHGARIAAGAVVAHATVGPDSTVPAGHTVCNQTWFGPKDSRRFEHDAPLSFDERLTRLLPHMVDGLQIDDQAMPTLHRHLYLKRLGDIIASGLALVVLAPLLGLVALAIWIESGRPVFYGDGREGLAGRVFKCWKFRTMFTGAHLRQRDLHTLDQTDGPHFKVDRDPRVTRVGSILRALNVDELPQLFNVFVGEMSLVGPRPSPFRENQVCVPWREARLSVRPGITGFWQVCRHDRAAGDFHQWIEYDLLYVQHLTFWLDVKILLATVLTLGGKAGHVPASWLAAGARSEQRAA